MREARSVRQASEHARLVRHADSRTAGALRGSLLVASIVALALVATTTIGVAAEPDPSVQRITDTLLAAIAANDRVAFVANATDAVAGGTTPEVMSALSQHLGARLKQGYEHTYLCALKQAGHDVYLWKLTFTDGGDDVVVRVVLKNGKVAGFFLQ